MADQQDPEQIEVKLKPILGLMPQIYVPMVYAVLAALLLFLVLFLPGIRNHGTLITFHSTPPDAAVFVDGNYAGYTPGTFFVESGTREITVSRPGFESAEYSQRVGGRLFASFFFPRRNTIRSELTLGSGEPTDLSEQAARGFAHWAVSGEASGRFEMPPVARSLSNDLSALRQVEGRHALEGWSAFLARSLPAVSSEASLLDLVSGTLAVTAETGVATPSGVAALVQAAADAPPALAIQLADILRRDGETLLLDSPWHTIAADQLVAVANTDSALEPASTGATLAAGGLNWVSVSSGSLLLPGASGADRGGDYPRLRNLGDFFVSETEVPIGLYARFVSERSFWAPENRDSIVAAGLADQHYLSGVDLDPSSDLPITEISAAAAAAFATWLDEQVPEGTVRLPSEDEWDAALVASQAEDGIFASNSAGGPVPVALAGSAGDITGLLGNVWEWTATPFARYSFLYPADGYVPANLRRVVRGGGWATGALGFSPWDRGAIPPEWTSPFIGIRLVLVPDR